MARLRLTNQSKTLNTIDEMAEDIKRRLSANAECCPVDAVSSFLRVCASSSCGKCVPCKIGLRTLSKLFDKILDGEGEEKDLITIRETAESIKNSSDCAIGYEGAKLALRALEDFKDDLDEHIKNGGCLIDLNHPVPCVGKCPANVDVPAYIACVKDKRYKDAVKVIRKDNPFPSVCGLICEHPCEQKCRRQILDAPINIRGLKRFAVENAGKVELPRPYPKTGKKIAVIGGGPSGLTAAYFLTLMGHSVTVFEEKKSLGGMLRYGIPSYRLPRERLDSEIEEILSLGIEVKKKVKVGKDITLSELKDKYDAVYIAIGAQTDKKLGIEGEDASGVISAVDMLKSIGDGEYPDFNGQDVIVVGGGNVAMDVARSAIRLNAKSVKIVYRRRKEDMTALLEEVDGAIADGCEIVELKAPLKIEKDDGGKVSAFWFEPQIIGEYDRGRPKPNKAESAPIRIPCDKVLIAIGQGIESKDFENENIPVKRGNIDAGLSCEIKDNEKVFSGGDCVTGPATVIRAIAAGKVAAANIDEYLGFNHEIKLDVEVPEFIPSDKKQSGRITMTERPPKERAKDFCLMELSMTEEEALKEANRCLRCDKCGLGSLKGGREIKW